VLDRGRMVDSKVGWCSWRGRDGNGRGGKEASLINPSWSIE
jgi:hypothetical protein